MQIFLNGQFPKNSHSVGLASSSPLGSRGFVESTQPRAVLRKRVLNRSGQVAVDPISGRIGCSDNQWGSYGFERHCQGIEEAVDGFPSDVPYAIGGGALRLDGK
jgi:hypothetical protein